MFTTKGARTYEAGGTIRDKRLVVRGETANTVVEAGAEIPTRGFVGIAYLNRSSVAAAALVAVEPLTPGNTLWGVAAGNVTYGAKLYAAADGKLSTTPVAGAFIGYAEQAGVADEEIEFRPAVDVADLVARLVALEA